MKRENKFYLRIREKLEECSSAQDRLNYVKSKLSLINMLYSDMKVNILTKSTDLVLDFSSLNIKGSDLEIKTLQGTKILHELSDVVLKGDHGLEFKGGNYVLDKQKHSLLIEYYRN
jgi:hypothetical protein